MFTRLCLSMAAFLLVSVSQVLAIDVFPGALGWGTDTPAGRGGDVVIVTSLQDYSPSAGEAAIPNTLRWALKDSSGAGAGARTIIFETSGTIYLREPLQLDHDSTTVAGETAPWPGIAVGGDAWRMEADELLIRHIRILGGDTPGPGINVGDPGTEHNDWFYERDCVVVFGLRKNVVFDHCTIAFSVDKAFEAHCAKVDGVTLSNSIVAMPLNRSVNNKARHGFGLLVGGDEFAPGQLGRSTYYRNLFSHSLDRNPLISSSAQIEVINNVIYGGIQAVTMSYSEQTTEVCENLSALRADVVGNIWVPPAKLPGGEDPIPTPWYEYPWERVPGYIDNVMVVRGSYPGGSLLYANDNQILKYTSSYFVDDTFDTNEGIYYEPSVPSAIGLATSSALSPGMEPDTTGNSLDAFNSVLGSVGAFSAARHSFEESIVGEVASGSGRIRHCVRVGEVLNHKGTFQNYGVEFNGGTFVQVDTLPEFPPGYDESAGSSGAFLNQIYPAFEGYRIRFWALGTGGLTQVDAEIVSYDESTRKHYINPGWPSGTSPLVGTQYELYTECNSDESAGGWPYLPPSTITHQIPDNPKDVNSSGYTNLEEWIHEFSATPEIMNESLEVQCGQVIVTWDTDIPCFSQVRYGPSGGSSWDETEIYTTRDTSHSVTVSLADPENYDFQPVALSVENSTSGLILTGKEPVISNVSAKAKKTQGTPKVTMSYETDASCKLWLREAGIGQFEATVLHSSIESGLHTHEVTSHQGQGLKSGTDYEVYAEVFETAGHCGKRVQSSVFTVRTPGNPGQSAPRQVDFVGILDASPNPFNSSTSVRFSITERSSARVEVYDVSGRIVHNVELGSLMPGIHEWTWDGKSDGNTKIPNGMYFVRLRAQGTSMTVKVLLSE